MTTRLVLAVLGGIPSPATNAIHLGAPTGEYTYPQLMRPTSRDAPTSARPRW